jgi:hypothetical protein
MNTLSVVDVYDGNTLVVFPAWELGGHKGNLVHIHGLGAPPLEESKGALARTKLTLLLIGCQVHIGDTYGIHGASLDCDVYYSGRHLAKHLPEYEVEEAGGTRDNDSNRNGATA